MGNTDGTKGKKRVWTKGNIHVVLLFQLSMDGDVHTVDDPFETSTGKLSYPSDYYGSIGLTEQPGLLRHNIPGIGYVSEKKCKGIPRDLRRMLQVVLMRALT